MGCGDEVIEFIFCWLLIMQYAKGHLVKMRKRRCEGKGARIEYSFVPMTHKRIVSRHFDDSEYLYSKRMGMRVC